MRYADEPLVHGDFAEAKRYIDSPGSNPALVMAFAVADPEALPRGPQINDDRRLL
jgi:hypothetical protein